MTVWEACAWTGGRSLVAAIIALLLAYPICRCTLASPQRARRRLAWALLLAPLLTPSMLVGYAYADSALSLVRRPGWNAALYVLLLALRYTPIAALLIYFSPPPPLSAQAMHCARLAQRGRALGFWLRGPARSGLVAMAVVFLLAFAEFEMATLLDARPQSWTVLLFRAQVGGQALAQTLRQALSPLACELAILAPLLALLLRSQHGPAPLEARSTFLAANRAATALAWGYLGAALLVGCVLPAAIVTLQSGRGFAAMRQSFAVLPQVGASSVFAGASALIALIVALRLTAPRGAGSAPPSLAKISAVVALCVPGLLGSLVVGLMMLGLFQQALAPLVRSWYDTPAPLLAALTLLLLPLAVLLSLLLLALRREQAITLADHLRQAHEPRVKRRGRWLVWQLVGRPRLWVWAVLFLLAYFDLSASALLYPSGMTPAPVLLYNQMHYGANSVLSAMVLITMAVPALGLLLVAAAGRAAEAWVWHD